MDGMPQVPNLDRMSPEQRARVEEAVKARGGAHTNTVKSCVTKERIENAIAKASSPNPGACAPKLVSATSSRVELRIDCSQEKSGMKSNGDILIERVDSEHFKGSGSVKTAGANGRAMDMKWSMTGAFVSADCGSVKPSGQ
jgi:hypothetical protein